MIRSTGRAVEVVSIRELSRQTRKVIGMVAEEGRSVLVKHGRHPVAMLVPLRGALRLHTEGQTGSEGVQTGSEGVSGAPAALDHLAPMERSVLTEILNGNSVIDRICSVLGRDPRDVALALARLEVKGMVRRTFSGYVPGD